MAGPSLDELRVLDEVARAGSLSGAARALGVSQQSVSARLRGLERRVRLELVLRSTAGAVLTEAGETMLAWAREVLDAADRLEVALDGLRGESPGRGLTIAASQTIAAHRLPGWLLALRNEELAEGSGRGTDFALRTGNSVEVAELVRSGVADLGFVETPELPRDLSCAGVQVDRMVAACAPQHPWTERDEVGLSEIAATALVTREVGSGTRAAYEHQVRAQAGAEPHEPAIVLSTEAAVRSAVAQGVAPAVLSPLTVRDDVRLGRIVAKAITPRVTRTFTAVWRGTDRDLVGRRRRLVEIAAAAGEGVGVDGAGMAD
ncbi:MAG: LysR family transcriptional regulator [Actinomycetaceae bacterium]